MVAVYQYRETVPYGWSCDSKTMRTVTDSIYNGNNQIATNSWAKYWQPTTRVLRDCRHTDDTWQITGRQIVPTVEHQYA